MRQHYNIDRLIEYGTEAIPDTTRVINPAWRQLDSQIRRQNGLLSRELVQFAQIELPQEMEPEAVQAYERQKGQMQQVIEERRQQIKQLKVQRKTKPKHIGQFAWLPWVRRAPVRCISDFDSTLRRLTGAEASSLGGAHGRFTLDDDSTSDTGWKLCYIGLFAWLTWVRGAHAGVIRHRSTLRRVNLA